MDIRSFVPEGVRKMFSGRNEREKVPGASKEQKTEMLDTAIEMVGENVWVETEAGAQAGWVSSVSPSENTVNIRTYDRNFSKSEKSPVYTVGVADFLNYQKDFKNKNPDLYYEKYNLKNEEIKKWIDEVLEAKRQGQKFSFKFRYGDRNHYIKDFRVIDSGNKMIFSHDLGEGGERVRTITVPTELMWRWQEGDMTNYDDSFDVAALPVAANSTGRIEFSSEDGSGYDDGKKTGKEMLRIPAKKFDTHDTVEDMPSGENPRMAKSVDGRETMEFPIGKQTREDLSQEIIAVRERIKNMGDSQDNNNGKNGNGTKSEKRAA